MNATSLAWLGVIAAGMLEVAWAVGLKQTAGFTRLWPSVATASAMMASFVLLSRALRTLPVGTAYAVWTGIGAVGAATIGVLFLGESASPLRIAAIMLIVLGIIGLKVAG